MNKRGKQKWNEEPSEEKIIIVGFVDMILYHPLRMICERVNHAMIKVCSYAAKWNGGMKTMDKQETIKEIRKYPSIYFDDLIQALNEQGIGKELLQSWVGYALKEWLTNDKELYY